MKRNPNCHCFVCNKRIYRRPSQIKSGRVYCSLSCTGLDQQKQKVCKVCGVNYIGAKRTCSRTCSNKSRAGIKYTKEGLFDKAYRGSVLKEKLAMRRGGVCERCEENNYAILQIHHKKERYQGGTDNSSNLELLCPNCHATHHLGKCLFKKSKSAKVQRTIEYKRRDG